MPQVSLRKQELRRRIEDRIRFDQQRRDKNAARTQERQYRRELTAQGLRQDRGTAVEAQRRQLAGAPADQQTANQSISYSDAYGDAQRRATLDRVRNSPEFQRSMAASAEGLTRQGLFDREQQNAAVSNRNDLTAAQAELLRAEGVSLRDRGMGARLQGEGARLAGEGARLGGMAKGVEAFGSAFTRPQAELEGKRIEGQTAIGVVERQGQTERDVAKERRRLGIGVTRQQGINDANTEAVRGQFGLERDRVQGQTARDVASITGQTALGVERERGGAMRDVAKTNAGAAIGVAKERGFTDRSVATTNAAATRDVAKTNAGAARDVAATNADAAKYTAEVQAGAAERVAQAKSEAEVAVARENVRMKILENRQLTKQDISMLPPKDQALIQKVNAETELLRKELVGLDKSQQSQLLILMEKNKLSQFGLSEPLTEQEQVIVDGLLKRARNSAEFEALTSE